MGTRGAYGFRKNGEDKVTYNHYDSYPSELGKNIIKFIEETSVKEMNKLFDKIVLVTENDKPTKEQIKECEKYHNATVSTGKKEEWYSLLRNSQGDLSVYKKGLKYMIDSRQFLFNSLWCEWAYIINLDEEVLEIYKGLQTMPHESRYCGVKLSGYYGVALVGKYPLNNLPEMKEDNLIGGYN